jgi:hypothetical protein
VSHLGGVNPTVKWKIQWDGESGNEILIYMQKLEKMTFTKGCQKNVTNPQKITKPKGEKYRNDQ